MAAVGAVAVGSSSNGGIGEQHTPPTMRRVSYVLNDADAPKQYFSLPDASPSASSSKAGILSRQGPLLTPSTKQRPNDELSGSRHNSQRHAYPRHRLPISSLAIDPTTSVQHAKQGTQERQDPDKRASPSSGLRDDHSKPSGILYMGGRDGMISAWELGLPMRRRRSVRSHNIRRTSSSAPWRSTASRESEGDGEHVLRSDLLMDEDLVAANGSREDGSQFTSRSEPIAGLSGSGTISRAWEVVPPGTSHAPSPGPATFRQCIGSHTDWINDVVLCNNYQTLISASSDRTVNLWNPHDAQSSATPHILGTHKDYVRALTHASEARWVASGSFDKTIKLWDISEVRSHPVVTIPESSVESSVYALATNARGSVMAGGSPEKVVRVWDPRSGRRISQLIGHTDTVRSVVLNEEGTHLLSASADSTIRLWSLSEQRCLHTFTHHSDSVWSLFSDHPDLDVFYSGDRSGLLCKVDWERCAEVSEGECVVLAQESPSDRSQTDFRTHTSLTGINKVVALDNSYVWTASANGNVSRWMDIAPRSVREEQYPLFPPRTSQEGPPDAPPFFRLSPSYSASANPRISALKGQTQAVSPSTSSVSFADQATARVSSRDDTPLLDSPRSGESGGMQGIDRSSYRDGSKLHGLPFDSLVCLAPLNDPFGIAIGLGSLSMRANSRVALQDEQEAPFNSASLVSIPAALQSSYQALHENEGSVRSSMQAMRQGTRPLLGQSPPAMSSAQILAQQMGDPSIAARPSSVRSGSLRFAPILPHSPEGDRRRIDESKEDEDMYDNGSDKDAESAVEARLAYEERDLAADAEPLRSAPEDVICGARGLIRSSMLSDRRHCLSIDTGAEICVWDLISGRCLGAFDWAEVLSAARSSGRCGPLQPGDALDLVRERIEGSSVSQNWCNVDTKIGSLSVHLEYPRCFDAELYIDECMDVLKESDPEYAFKDDQRVNVGLMVLKGIFTGFLQREATLRLAANNPLKDGILAYEKPELMDRIEVAPDPDSAQRSRLQLARSSTAPGMAIAIAQQPRTPAILPIHSPLTPTGEHGMNSLQKLLESQRQATGTSRDDDTRKTDPTATPSKQPSDYFSIESSTAPGSGTTTPRAKTPGGDKGAAAAVSPGGSGTIMSRLRMGLRRENVQQKRDSKSTAPGTSQNAIQGVSRSVSDKGGDSEAEQQLHTLRDLFARASAGKSDASPGNEIPKLEFPPETSVILSESSHDSGGFQVSYRGLVSSTERDTAILEMRAPFWLLEHLLVPGDDALTSLRGNKDKLTFWLLPWSPPTSAPPSSDLEQCKALVQAEDLSAFDQLQTFKPMAALPGNNARLTATRMLRIKKACGFVADKLQLFDDETGGGQRSGLTSIAVSRRSSASAQATSGVGALAGLASRTIVSSGEAAGNSDGNLPSNKSSSSRTEAAADASATAAPRVPAGADPSDVIELLCNDTVVPPHATLAQVHRYLWKSGSPIKLEYRWKDPALV